MPKNIYQFLLGLSSILFFFQCNPDLTHTPSQFSNLIIHEDCNACPAPRAINFSYSAESAAFKYAISVQNELTQYHALPVKIDLFQENESGTLQNLTDIPEFITLLETFGIPEDTLSNIIPFNRYSIKQMQSITNGLVDEITPCNSCEDQYQWPEVPLAYTESGNCIAPDSLNYVISDSDLCAMMNITHALSFSFFPFELIDPSKKLESPDKSNVQFDQPFFQFSFDKRNLEASIDLPSPLTINTNLSLTDCPIFNANDGSIPNEFGLGFDYEMGIFSLTATWSDGSQLKDIELFVYTGDEISQTPSYSWVGTFSQLTNGSIQLSGLKDHFGATTTSTVALILRSDATTPTINQLVFSLVHANCNSQSPADLTEDTIDEGDEISSGATDTRKLN